MRIRSETAFDAAAIRRVHEAAFRQSQEADLVDALREQHLVTVSLVAEIGDAIVGHVLLSHLDIIAAGRSIPAAALGPVAVSPQHRNQGIGSKLTAQALEQARQNGIALVLVLGHPTYYPRFGFCAGKARHLASPYSSHGDAWMAAELISGALPSSPATVAYPAPWAMFD